MHQRGVRQASVVVGVVLALAIVVGGFPAVAGGTAVTSDLAQQTTPANNTTVQQEDPETVSQRGDSEQVSQWLQSRLTRQLEGSAANISQGQYEQAEEALGDDYDERLGQYVNVAGNTDSDVDDQAAETLNQTRRDQQALANATQSYNETFREYEEARAVGNTTAAREAARELETLSERVNRLNGTVNGNYQSLENQTGVQTDPAQDAVTNTSREVNSQQETVRTETFTQTELNVTANGSAVAFDNPLTIEGRLTNANGTAITNQTVPIRVHNRTYESRTDGDGRFNLSYRPVSLPVNATTVTIAYRPRGDSPYLGNNTTAQVNVSQVTPTLNVTLAPRSVRYGTQINTTATVTADGRPVPGLPLRSTISGVSQSSTTESQGQVRLTQDVPARVPSGQQSVRITTSSDDMAVGPVSANPTVAVQPTATTATVNATAIGGQIRIAGRLVTPTERPVRGQSLQVRVGNRTQTVPTNRTGHYRATFTNSSQITADSRPVTVQFNGTGTNLESTETNATVAIPWAERSTATVLTQQPVLIGLILLGFVLVIGTVAWSRWDGATEQPQAPSQPEPGSSADPEPTVQTDSWLEQAQSALANNEFERAVIAAYASVRWHLEATEGIDDTLTHREFVVATDASRTDNAELQVVADAYEQVQFTETVETAAVTAAVEAAAAVRQDTDT